MENEIKSLLCSLPGAVAAARVQKEDLPGILKEETEYEEDINLIKLVNLGIRKIALCEYVFVFLKDGTFRRPPSPTVYLVEDTDWNSDSDENPVCAGVKSGNFETEYLNIDGLCYHIVGEEVIDLNKKYREKTSSFNKEFVLFPERRRKTKRIPAYFLIPPLPFPELDSLRNAHKIGKIMSVSPSSRCDAVLREKYNLSKNPENGTILIGLET